jgi:hypothetical protein
MKSIAAYYTFIAVNSLDDDAERRRAAARAARATRPSIMVRARAFLSSRTSSRAAHPATTAA